MNDKAKTLEELVTNLALTLGAVVEAAGGVVVVPKDVFEKIHSFEIEKSAPDPETGAIVYTTRRKNDG